MSISGRILLLLVLLVPGPAYAQDAPVGLDVLVARYKGCKPKEHKARRTQLRAIAALRSRASRDFLLAELQKEREARYRVLLLEGLSETPDAKVLGVYKTTIKGRFSYGEKRTALQGLRRFRFDWKAFVHRLILGGLDGSLRTVALRTLASDPDAASKRYLAAAYVEGSSDWQKVQVMRVLASGWGVERIYKRFLAPNLVPEAPSGLRQEALRLLASAGDRRFFSGVRANMASDSGTGRRARWISWASQFKDLRALRLMLALLEPRSNQVTTAFLRGVARLDDPRVSAWFLKEGARHTKPLVRRAAVAVLRKGVSGESRRALLRLARDPAGRIAQEAIDALGDFHDPGVSRFLGKLVSDRDPVIATEALRAWWRCEKQSESVVKAITEIARRSRSWQMRVAAIDLLKNDHAVRCEKILRANCWHPASQVRSAAYEALTWVRTRETLDFLIDRIEREHGRVLYDLVDALFDLTGFNFDTRIEDWRSWWARSRETYPLPPKSAVRKRAPPPAGYAVYYGIAVRSDRVVFVLDISGSMSAASGKSTRIGHAKRNLVSVVKGLHKDTRFEVIAFDSVIRPWQGDLVRASKMNKAGLAVWSRNLAAQGNTNLFGALMAAFDLEDVDTIFLLSDGAPSGGEIDDMGEILRKVAMRNRFRRVRINSIAIGVTGATERFLRNLADGNHGQFVKGG